jgi:hypothetical protein
MTNRGHSREDSDATSSITENDCELAAHRPSYSHHSSKLGYWGWLASVVIVLVIGVVRLYAYRAFAG